MKKDSLNSSFYDLNERGELNTTNQKEENI
jgi:hypothetical protein